MVPISEYDSQIVTILLDENHDTSFFDCGNSDLNEFLKTNAIRYASESLAKTFLFMLDKDIVGYISLCADSIRLTTAERKALNKTGFPVSDFPAFKIARLAIDKRFQKRGYGKALLFWAVGHIQKIAIHAARYVTVDSESESLSFYEKFDFIRNHHERHNKPKRSTISLRFDLHELAFT